MHLVIILAAFLDFGTGPAQWLMTAEEQKAWRAVKTEEEGKNFAELFWARRDPTPGTPRNEFRDEFDSRVSFADREFKEGNIRGALTERGRDFIVLGLLPKPAGAGRLTFMKDAWAMKPQSGKDPFVGLPELTEFTREDDLGWGAEYCTGMVSEGPPSVMVKVNITGTIQGERVNFRGEPEEFVPDSIRVFPGCYVVRGDIPLSDFDPGTYTLSITLGSYNLTKQFKVN